MSMINDIFRSLCCSNIFKVGGMHNEVCVNWSLMVTNIDVPATTVSSPKQIVSDSFFNLFRGWIVGRYVLPICGLSATVFHQPQPEDSQKTRRSNKGTLTPMSESQSYFKLTSHATRCYSVKHQLQWDVRIRRLVSVTGPFFLYQAVVPFCSFSAPAMFHSACWGWLSDHCSDCGAKRGMFLGRANVAWAAQEIIRKNVSFVVMVEVVVVEVASKCCSLQNAVWVLPRWSTWASKEFQKNWQT